MGLTDCPLVLTGFSYFSDALHVTLRYCCLQAGSLDYCSKNDSFSPATLLLNEHPCKQTARSGKLPED